jgi:L-ribulokinase
MTIVAGVDFGTLSVRVSLFDSRSGPIGTASASYPLHRRHDDPNFATQSHADQMSALAAATRDAIRATGVDGTDVAAIALDTTGSSVIPVGESLEPLDNYYLWCDHRAFGEAEEITAKAHELGFEGIDWCGGVYSSEWGFSKLLHWLRHNPKKRSYFVTALEHCDMVAATLSGITAVSEVKRSVCAMGHKWMWNPKWGGLPPEEFLVAVDPLFAGVRAKIGGEFLTSEHLAGHLSAKCVGPARRYSHSRRRF